MTRWLILIASCYVLSAQADDLALPQQASSVFSLSLRQQRFDLTVLQQPVLTQLDQVELMYLEQPLALVQTGLLLGKSFMAQSENSITNFAGLSGYYGGVLVRIAYPLASRISVGGEGRYAYYDIREALSPTYGFTLHQWQGQILASWQATQRVSLYLGERVLRISGTLVSNLIDPATVLIDKAFYTTTLAGLAWQSEPGGVVGIEFGRGELTSIELFFQRYY